MSYRLIRIIEENPVAIQASLATTTYTYVDDDGREITTTDLLVDVDDVREAIATTRTEKRFDRGVIATIWNVASNRQAGQHATVGEVFS